MARKRRIAPLVAAAVGIAGAAWWIAADDDATGAGTDHLINQVWVERVPTDHRDAIAHLLVLDHPRARRFGVAGRSSQWRHMIEVFMWQLDGDALDLRFPQDRVRTRVSARTWACEDTAPEPFELCLELSRGDRKVRFYSRYDWEVDPASAAEDLAELTADTPALAPALAPAMAGLAEPATPRAPDEDAADWPEVDRLP